MYIKMMKNLSKGGFKKKTCQRYQNLSEEGKEKK